MTLRSTVRRRFSSVGTKIAGATLLVLAVVTAAGYVEVSRHERDTLLQAKESAASTVARLFAAGLVAPIEFTDDKGALEKASLILSDEEVVRAAVYVVDPDDRASIILRLAEVRRGSDAIPLPTVHADVRVHRGNSAVTVEAPVVAANHVIVGMVQTSFSLDKEKAGIAVMERRVLFGAAAVAVLIAALLLTVTRYLITKRLTRLALAVRSFEEGHASLGAEILGDAAATDEVGELARAFETMTESIATRERRISQRNRDLRRVLDHAAEGFLTVDRDGMITGERSLVLDSWFGQARENESFFDFVGRIAPEVAPWLRLGWAALRDDFMPYEVVLDQLGRRFQTKGRSLELEFRPILEHEVLVQVLVVVRDVTESVERERAEMAQREATAIFRRMLADRAGFEELMSEAGSLVRQITGGDAADLARVTRAIHTLKGITAVFEIESISRFCHTLEQRMLEDRTGPSIAERVHVSLLWGAIIALHRQLGGHSRDRIEVPREDYARLLAELDRGAEHSSIAAFVRSWRFERASTRVSRIVSQLSSIARRLGKGDVELRADVHPPDLRLPAERWAGVWSAFSHLLRNALDHGIEPLGERRSAGKIGAGHVAVSVHADDQEVSVSIADDGRGIAWEKIREAAIQRGLPAATQADLEEALYADTVTSRDVVTETSGRGVGLGAVREAIQGHGGSIAVTSATGLGTTFCLRLPRTMLSGGSLAPSEMPRAA